MKETAEYVINNLLDDISNFGFIPNGGRIYYLDRSQPPLLSEMIKSYLDAVQWSSSEGMAMLQRAYPLLVKEYEWWMDPENGHVVTITLASLNGPESYTLNRYFSNETSPRPESYTEDVQTATTAADPLFLGRPREDTYVNIRAGAESGWDFSSRWISGPEPKANITR